MGILTCELVKAARQVYVIEIEHRLVIALEDMLGDVDNLEIIEGDALTVDLPVVNKIVSNLPYSISSEITFRLLQELNFERAILMFQKEFAKRLFAEPGTRDYSRLTINFKYQAKAELLLDVPARLFYPVPAVDSVVLQVKQRKYIPQAKDDSVFYWMINGIFSYPNKNLRRALKIWLRNIGSDEALADLLIAKCGGNVKQEDKLRTIPLNELVTLSNTVLEFIEERRIPNPRGK